MIYICKQCGREFNGKPSAHRIYCSKACHISAQTTSSEVQCYACGKTIMVPPSDHAERHFCSQECRLTWLSQYVKQEVNVAGHSSGHKARHLTELNKRRNRLLALEPNAANRGSYYRQKHRKIMEELLGRKLLPNEDVHHINGIYDDNRPENLMVMDHSDHLKLHWRLFKEKEAVKNDDSSSS